MANQEPWIADSVRTMSSVQSDTAAGVCRTDLTSPAASSSGFLSEARAQGKPVMGLRQHNQTRKPRILSQAQLSQSSGGGNVAGNGSGGDWLRRSSVQGNQLSQPNSEFSLNFGSGEQMDDRVHQVG